MAKVPDYALRRSLLNMIHVTDNGCWIWQGSRAGKPEYGRVFCKLEGDKVVRGYRAHRISFIAFRRSIGKGKKICHTCDTPLCIRPSHLFEGTQSQNLLDCSAKGRLNTSKGENHYRTILTEQDIEEIRCSKGKVRQADLAKKYGVCQPHISVIQQLKKRT